MTTREYSAKYYQTHKVRCRELNRRSRFKTVYGITPEFYHALVVILNGQCMICRKSTKLTVDHQHNPKVFRGLLCSSCNRALGWFKDNLDILKSAVKYMEGFNARNL